MGVTSSYTYDPIYELTQVTQANNTTESYSYDAVGNRTASLGVSSYTTNASNELTATSNATYTYDSNGNTLTKTVGSNTTTYAWDFENRLTGVTLPGTGGTVTFKYDPLGRRIEKASPTFTSIFAYDGDNLIETVNSTGSVVSRYAQGENIDEPLAEDRSGATSYYEADGLGSVSSLTSSTGALADTYAYDSFGNWTNSSGSVSNPFSYTAREFDAETNLYYYRNRYYDATVGRFISEDPIGFGGGSVDFYSYVLNNPVVFVDAFGLWRNTHKPADPHVNTIVCNGQGGIRVQVGNAGTPAQAKCIGDCIQAHEQKHRQDALAANPKVCSGAADGIQVGFSNTTEQRQDEVLASNVEISCLKAKAGSNSNCPNCTQTILDRIKQIEAYRDSFNK